MHQISGILDGTTTSYSPVFSYTNGLQQANPGCHYWVRLDQLVRSWIFATIFKDLLCEGHDLIHGFDIWKCLDHQFNTAILLVCLI